MTFFGIYSVFSFLMGAVVASFLNVVIWRVPRGESIVRPASHCPKCNVPIRWWQNIPILSYLALRGRCAKCRAPISPRYLCVELLGGVLFLAAFLRFGPLAPLLWVWMALMIVGSFIDFDLQLLPDFVTVGGMIYGVGLSLVVEAALRWTLLPDAFWAAIPAAYIPFPPPLWSLGGLALGFGLLWLVRFLGSKAFRREAMGMGDVFLLGAVGALFGPVAVFVTLMAGAVAGSLVGVGMILLNKARLGRFVAIPFGPWLCFGCLVWIFRGPELVHWYLSLLHV